jgi:predicted nucleic-acid-binding protein
MIGIDTNVLVRYLVADDARQAALAAQFLERTLSSERPGFIGNIVLCELFWVLDAGYGYPRAEIAATLQRLLEVDRLRFESPAEIWQALDDYRSGADFADALLARIHQAAGCETTVTLDRRAATRIRQMRLLQR